MVSTRETDPWSFVTQMFHNGKPNHDCARKTSERRD